MLRRYSSQLHKLNVLNLEEVISTSRTLVSTLIVAEQAVINILVGKCFEVQTTMWAHCRKHYRYLTLRFTQVHTFPISFTIHGPLIQLQSYSKQLIYQFLKQPSLYVHFYPENRVYSLSHDEFKPI